MAEMRCDTAENGEIALEKMQDAVIDNDPYSLVIVDYLMPDMNGEMLADCIKDYDDFQDTCLVMLTAAGSPVKDNYFAGKGFSAYLSKPVRAHALIETLALVWESYSSGNCETMIDPETGGAHTAHTLNPVPVAVVGGPDGASLRSGRLADLAPTVLQLMGLDQPAEMTGKSLLE